MSFKDPETGAVVQGVGVVKLSFSHKAMADLMIANPQITGDELAVRFGYTRGWVSQVMSTDAFQAYLATRKSELVDPILIRTVEERLRGVAAQALDILNDKLPVATFDQALEAAKFAAGNLGGGKNQGGGVNVAVVVQVPQKSPSAEAWAEKHSPPVIEEAVIIKQEVATGVDHETAKVYP